MKRALLGALLLGMALSGHADDAPDLEHAKRLVSGRCFLCHGMKGEAASELSPRLAGQNASYLEKQLSNFKSGERVSSAMRPMVANLSTQEMRALALYFSLQPVAPHPMTEPGLVARGRQIYEKGGTASEVAACVGCHGERAHGSDNLPRLAGQIPSYLVAQLKGFSARKRTNDNAVMHAIAERMTAEEMEAVASYLSTLE